MPTRLEYAKEPPVMIPEMPSTVQQAWGEVATRDFARWMEVVMEEREESSRVRLARIDERLGGIDARLDAQLRRIDERFATNERRMDERFEAFAQRMDERFEAFAQRMDERFARLELRLDERHEAFVVRVDARLDRFAAETNARFDALHRLIVVQTRWNIGLLGLFATLATLLLALQTFRG